MDVGAALCERARNIGACSVAVVGTSKNAGKSVVVAALADALAREGGEYGLCSIGRDGELADALDGATKPRFFLRPRALVATAVALLPRSPALEIISVMNERSALGAIALARVRAPGFVEIAGPPSATALRRVVRALLQRVPFIVIDGAVDRIAALRDGSDAIVVAVGASGAPSLAHALDDVEALVARLQLPAAGDVRDGVRVVGALTARAAAAHVRDGGGRPLIVADPTHVLFGGRTFLELRSRLDLRCDRTLAPIACTVAPLGTTHAFEPAAFARGVAERTGLPVYDVYAAALTQRHAA